MHALIRVAVALVLVAQTLNPSAREMVNVERPLTAAEIAAVFAASRDALGGKTLRLAFAPTGVGPEFRIGAGGRPRIMRTTMSGQAGWVGGRTSDDPNAPVERYEWHEDLIQISDYTGQPARRCDGTVEPGEMVIEYEHKSSTNAWTATARAQTTLGVRAPGYAPLFNMLMGTTPATSGERTQLGDRPARAFVARWTPPTDTGLVEIAGDPAPNVRGSVPDAPFTQTLWIDTVTLLPLRWEVARPGVPAYGFNVFYEPIDIQPPPAVQAPDCIR